MNSETLSRTTSEDSTGDSWLTPEVLKYYQDHPEAFCREVLGLEPWDKQTETLQSVRNHQRTAVRSCTSAGKSRIAAAAAIWYLNCFCPSTVITTAPTFRQVKTILWKHIRALHKRAKYPLGGDLLETELKLDEDWFAMGISTKEPDRIQGYHNGINMLVVVDEAPGVSQEIFDAMENVMASGGNVRLLMLGNPTALSGEFHAAFQSKRSTYNCIHIDGEDTPNVKAGRIIIPGLITREWIEDRKKMWGVDSPLYRVKVKGNFPLSESDTLIPVDWVEKAFDRWHELKAEGDPYVGNDPARFGNDETAFATRRGRKVLKVWAYNGFDTMQTVGHVVIAAKELRHAGRPIIRADSIGVGGGVVDRLIELCRSQNPDEYLDAYVEGVNVGESTEETETYANLRAEYWWTMRTALDPDNENAIGLPRDDVLAGELTSIKYRITSTGKIQIESKEEMRKRGLRSPDRAEAVMLTLNSPTQATGFMEWMRQEVEAQKKKEKK